MTAEARAAAAETVAQGGATVAEAETAPKEGDTGPADARAPEIRPASKAVSRTSSAGLPRTFIDLSPGNAGTSFQDQARNPAKSGLPRNSFKNALR